MFVARVGAHAAVCSLFPVVHHSPPFIVPCCSLFPIIFHPPSFVISHCLLFPANCCHHWLFPIVHCSLSLLVIFSTSIPSYKQWLEGRVNVALVTGQKRPVATLQAEACSGSTGVCCLMGGQCHSQDTRT